MTGVLSKPAYLILYMERDLFRRTQTKTRCSGARTTLQKAPCDRSRREDNAQSVDFIEARLRDLESVSSSLSAPAQPAASPRSSLAAPPRWINPTHAASIGAVESRPEDVLCGPLAAPPAPDLSGADLRRVAPASRTTELTADDVLIACVYPALPQTTSSNPCPQLPCPLHHAVVARVPAKRRTTVRIQRDDQAQRSAAHPTHLPSALGTITVHTFPPEETAEASEVKRDDMRSCSVSARGDECTPALLDFILGGWGRGQSRALFAWCGSARLLASR